MIAMKNIWGVTGLLLLSVSGVAIAQTPVPPPAPAAPAAVVPAPAAPAPVAPAVAAPAPVTPTPVAPAAPAVSPPAASAPAAPATPAAAVPAASPPPTAPAVAPKAAAPAAPAAPTAAAPAPKVDPAMAKFMASCKADVEKYCADAVAQRKAATSATKVEGVTPAAKGKGRGQVVACLNTNLASLTPECKTAFEERKAAAKAKKS